MASALRKLGNPGSMEDMDGDFTRLRFLLSAGLLKGDQAGLENVLGYGPGRLDAGYWLLLLKAKPQPGDVKAEGWTSQSGGRVGLPADSEIEDEARLQVSETFRLQRHEEIDNNLALSPATREKFKDMSDAKALKAMADNVHILGAQRAVKIFPATKHQGGMSPKDQYPAGAGALQYTLHRKLNWFVAAQVQPGGAWLVPPTWPINPVFPSPGGNSYEDRAAISKWLEEA